MPRAPAKACLPGLQSNRYECAVVSHSPGTEGSSERPWAAALS